MVSRQRKQVMNPPLLQGVQILGTEIKTPVDRSFPIEEMIVIVSGTVGAAALVLTQPDGILGIIKKLNFSANDGSVPRNIVDFTGVGLLEYASNAGLNLDHATLEMVRFQTTATNIPANSNFRIAYRVPLVHPMIQEPLRARMVLPCHKWDQDMVLSLTIAGATEIASAGTLSGLSVEIVLVRRVVSVSLDADILATGGYIPFDLIEQPFTIGVGVSGEQRIQIQAPGSYANLQLRCYKGGAVVTRDVVDAVTTLGNETKWRLESGGSADREFRFKHEQIFNEYSRPKNALSLTGSPSMGGVQAANALFLPAGSIMLDFLGDGLNDANELGSILDLNLPQRSGLKMELVGAVANSATNGHTIYYGGHRFYGDLSPWQAGVRRAGK